MSKQDIRRGRKSVQQLFTMCRRSVQSQQSPGALPWSSSSLPAACHLALSYFWDIVPSLEKQTLSPLSSPIKKKKKKPPQNKTIQNSFLQPQWCFQNDYSNVGPDAKCLGGRGFICQVPRWKFPLHSKRGSPVAKET